MRITALILVMALAPGAAVAQVTTAEQEEVQRSTEAATTQQQSRLAAESSEQLEVPQRLLRTFELLRQPGMHPELMELLGIEAALEPDAGNDLEPSSAPMTTSAAALSKGAKIGIISAVVVVVLVLFVGLCAGDSCWWT